MVTQGRTHEEEQAKPGHQPQHQCHPWGAHSSGKRRIGNARGTVGRGRLRRCHRRACRLRRMLLPSAHVIPCTKPSRSGQHQSGPQEGKPVCGQPLAELPVRSGCPVRATEPFVDLERHRRTAYQAVGGRLWNRPKATNATGRFGTWRSDIPIDLKMRLGAVVSARIERVRANRTLVPTRRPATLAGGTRRSRRRSSIGGPWHAHSLVLIQTRPSRNRLTRMQA